MLAPVALFLLAARQALAHPASALSVELVTAQFQSADIVPAILPTFKPQGTLIQSYPGSDGSGAKILSTGINLTVAETQTRPSISIKGTAESEATVGGPFNVTTHKYTVMIVDVGPVGSGRNGSAGTSLPSQFVRHYLENNLIYGQNDDHAVLLNSTVAPITAYAGPAPPAGSGAHRYVSMAFLQPENFAAPDGFDATLPVGTFDFLAYASSANLTLLVANYFSVEQGAATVSLMPTAAVQSTTLKNYTPRSSSGAMTGSHDHSHGTASAAGASAAASEAAKSGAFPTAKASSVGVVVLAAALAAML